MQDIAGYKKSPGSIPEVQSHLYVALDLGYISENSFNECYKITSSTDRLVLGFIKYLSNEQPMAD
jgi:four helix bundle protein